MTNYVTISIPEELYRRAEKWIKENGSFSSVDELIKFLIEEFIGGETEEVYTPEQEEEIKERLRRLGYL